MNRRKFLQMTPAAMAALYLNNHPVQALAASPLLELMAKKAQTNGRVFVLIQLFGGNDGLNTLIPLDQYSGLSAARSNILIPAEQVLTLADTVATGLHPAMSGMHQMYADGRLSIVQGVSYPNPDFSHFRAADIWTSASDSTQYLDTGWLGRYLDIENPGFPTGYPNASTPDPLAIQIGSIVTQALQGPYLSMGMAITDVNSFYNIVSGAVEPSANTPCGHELNFIRRVEQQTATYNNNIKQAGFNAPSNLATYPSNNALAEQLKIVARLIKGGLETPLYVVSMGSFDTHATQTAGPVIGNAQGTHADLLRTLSTAVAAFQSDLVQMQISDRVCGMTFSEFGRRIVSNASGGTDHGTAAPVFVFGDGVNPGLIGANPTIAPTVTAADNLPMQNDFRSIYSSVLKDWFEISDAEMQQILNHEFETLPIFRGADNQRNVHAEQLAAGAEGCTVFPNPVSRNVSFEFLHTGGNVTIELYDLTGKYAGCIYNNPLSAGRQTVSLQRNQWRAGQYVYRVRSGSRQEYRGRMLVTE